VFPVSKFDDSSYAGTGFHLIPLGLCGFPFFDSKKRKRRRFLRIISRVVPWFPLERSSESYLSFIGGACGRFLSQQNETDVVFGGFCIWFVSFLMEKRELYKVFSFNFYC